MANGIQDVMAQRFDSFAMAQGLRRARLVLYPKAGHGFLFQLPERFTAEVDAFLDDPDPDSDLAQASSDPRPAKESCT